MEDVLGRVVTAEAHFWPGKRAAAVTEFHIFPRAKGLHIWLCGGDMTELVEEMLPAVEAYGREHGCDHVSTCGRPGWNRVLKPKGFEPQFYIATKELLDG